MRATTIRFTPELWELLERESRREGVSVAQYVRDAALFRIAYTAGMRAEESRQPSGELSDEISSVMARARDR